MTDGQEARRQQRGEESREALLRAGVELLQEHGLDSILGARAVSERAQRSTGSFFHHWKRTDDYVRELLEFVLRPGTVPEVEDTAEMLGRLAQDPRESAALLRAILRYDFLEIVKDPMWPIQLMLSKYDDPRARAAVRGFYELTAELLVPRYELLCEAWGRRARAPFDLRTIEVITTAVVEGLALRKLIQPEVVPESLPGDVVLALITTFLADKEDPNGFDEVVGEIDGYAATT